MPRVLCLTDIVFRLSSFNESVSVLVIEAGISNVGILPCEVPFLATSLAPATPETWNFTTIPQKRLQGRNITYPRGKLLGGSSSISTCSRISCLLTLRLIHHKILWFIPVHPSMISIGCRYLGRFRLVCKRNSTNFRNGENSSKYSVTLLIPNSAHRANEWYLRETRPISML